MELFYIVSVIILGFVGTGTAIDSLCCPGGLPVIYRKPGVYSCWNPASGDASPITLQCKDPAHLPQSQETNLKLNYDGELLILMRNREISYKRDTFCVGLMMRRNKSTTSASMRPIAVLCNEEETVTINQETYGYLMVVSALFLVATAVVYLTKPDHKDLLSKSIVSFCCSLATGLGIMAIMKLISYSDMNLCAARGFLAYYFLMASFFWMNAIAVQMLETLMRGSESSVHGWGIFAKYASYAWGIPSLLAAVMAVVNFMPGDHLKPGIGLNHCWFFDVKQQWQYMYSPMAAIMVFNICVFLYAFCQYYSSASTVLKNKLNLSGHLFAVMGFVWTLEMVSSLVKTNQAWEVVNVIISLQGFLIFVVLVMIPFFFSSNATSVVAERKQYVCNIVIDNPYKKMVDEKY